MQLELDVAAVVQPVHLLAAADPVCLNVSADTTHIFMPLALAAVHLPPAEVASPDPFFLW